MVRTRHASLGPQAPTFSPLFRFFNEANPNDAVTAARGQTVPDTCELNFFHKDRPSPEVDSFQPRQLLDLADSCNL